jgi:TolA-binding protein
VVGLAGLVAVIGGAAWLAGAGISRPDGHAREATASAPIAVPSEVPTDAAIVRLDTPPQPIANVHAVAVPASSAPASSAPESSASASSAPASRPSRPTRPAKAKPAPTVPDPEDLFARANAARDAGHDAEAADLYRALLARRPEPDSANVARIDLALLYLRRLDRPADALGLFEDYLRAAPDGTLAERALVGKADALARLGRVDDERAAWQALLERWPESLQASRARRRLEHR